VKFSSESRLFSPIHQADTAHSPFCNNSPLVSAAGIRSDALPNKGDPLETKIDRSCYVDWIGRRYLSPTARANNELGDGQKIKHVLLISVDGLHALDASNYVASHPNSALAELADHGITYSNARTPALSDTFPGLLALVTGGSPVSHGLFYDVSYDRGIFRPHEHALRGTTR